MFESEGSVAQYHLIDEIKTEEVYPAEFDFNGISYEMHKDIFFQVNTNTPDQLVITGSDVHTGRTKIKDTIYGFPNYFKIQDVAINDHYICIIGHKKYLYFNRLDKKAHLYLNANNDIAFVNGDFLNDSLLVLHTVYNYHPKSSPNGLHINILNLRTNKFERTFTQNIPGVVASVINQSWVGVVNNMIVVAIPLTAKLYVYNDRMNKREYQLNILNRVQHQKNKIFEEYLDSLVKKDREALENGNTSYIYSKEFIGGISDSLSNNFSYIEKVITIDKHTICVTVSQPVYGNGYRDIYFLDANTFDVKRVIKKWPIAIPPILNKKEDFYAIDLSCNRKMGPFFYKGFIYVASVFPTELYINGPAEKLSEIMFNHIRKKGYTCAILKFEY